MMPGDSQAKTVAIAADATVGNCQNCSVLHQSLNEYVSSLLALKQKITVTDDSIRLKEQLEELQIKLANLEKKTMDYESVQAELEEKKDALKAYEQMSEKMETLRQDNSKALAENKKLEGQLKDVKELTEKQSFENAQLKREKAAVENDLLETQTSLKKSMAQADQVEQLKEENAKTVSIKDDLENKVRLLEESVCKQNQQITRLTNKKVLLENHIVDLQARIIKLERERSKEQRSSSTQASVPDEPKVDKEKFLMLLGSLWACVEPQQQHSNLFHPQESSSRHAPPSSPQKRLQSRVTDTSTAAVHKISEFHSSPVRTNATHTQLELSLQRQKAVGYRSGLQLTGKKPTDTPKKTKRLKEQEPEESPPDLDSCNVSVEEIMAIFKPMLPVISPLPDEVETQDTEMEPMQTDEEPKKNHPEPPDNSVALQQEETFQLVTAQGPSHFQSSSAAPFEDNLDLSSVTLHRAEDISNGNSKDFVQNEFSSITEMKDKSRTDAEVDLQKDMQTKQELETGNLSCIASTSISCSSMLDIPVLVEAVSLSLESPEPTCSANTNRNVSFGSAKEDHPEADTKADLNESPGDDACAKTVTTDCKDLPGMRESTVVSEETGDDQTVTSLISTISVKDTEAPNTENGSEENQKDSLVLTNGSQGATVLEPKEEIGWIDQDANQPEDNTSVLGSTDDSTCLKNENVEERLEIDPRIRHHDGNNAKGKGAVDVKGSPSESHGDNRAPSPQESPKLKSEDDEPCVDKECEQVSEESPTKKDPNTGTLQDKVPEDCGLSLSDSRETDTINCQSSKENTHSMCRALSPVCLLATLNMPALENQPSPQKLNVSVNVKHISEDEKPLQPKPSSEEEGATDIVNYMPQDSTKTSFHKVSECKLGTAYPTTPLKQNLKCSESQTDVIGKQSQCRIKEEEPVPVTGSSSAQPQECLVQVRSEMGPPLPPILTPLSTPPKVIKSINPSHAIGKLLFPSPMEGLDSPTTQVQAHLTPNSQHLSYSSFNSPVRQNGVPSSPLQFGSATPKHAVPVPGRLPLTAMTPSPLSSSNPSQENSMRILDTMYPELSAHARTLNILRGNVSLSICSSENGTSPSTSTSQMSGFKSINSTSTAFTKTETRGVKRQADSLPQPKNSKCLRMDSCSPVSRKQVPSSSSNSGEEKPSPQTELKQRPSEATPSSIDEGELSEQNLMVNYLKKIEKQHFDLLPVIQSHLFVGNLCKKPVMRDEEKEVISEVFERGLADDMIVAILNKLKAEKTELSPNYIQALCRVHTGICRQRRDWERAHILAYSILTEDFPDAAKLILFMVTTWPNVLSHSSSLCQAIHTVTKLKTPENLLGCLSAFLGWEKSPPCDIEKLIFTTLSDIKSGSSLSFSQHSRFGVDLGTEAWQHVFTLHLLCSHKKWKWTYENLLGNNLWPLMNTWVTQPRDQQAPVSDVTVAAVLRLIGRLGQMGIKERCVSTVVTVANVINTFGRQGQAEGVPWDVQLAAIYCIHDLSPCNPKQALDALAGWREELSQSVPAAVTSCMNQLASICRQIKR